MREETPAGLHWVDVALVALVGIIAAVAVARLMMDCRGARRAQAGDRGEA